VGCIIGFVMSSSPESAAAMASLSTPHEANPVPHATVHSAGASHGSAHAATAAGGDKEPGAEGGARAFRWGLHLAPFLTLCVLGVPPPTARSWCCVAARSLPPSPTPSHPLPPHPAIPPLPFPHPMH
jgi:hypothetical protein